MILGTFAEAGEANNQFVVGPLLSDVALALIDFRMDFWEHALHKAAGDDEALFVHDFWHVACLESHRLIPEDFLEG